MSEATVVLCIMFVYFDDKIWKKKLNKEKQ